MAQPRRHGGAFKARVPIEAIAGHKTVNEIAGAYQVHPSQVGKWKAEALKRLPEVLADAVLQGRTDDGPSPTAGYAGPASPAGLIRLVRPTSKQSGVWRQCPAV